MKCIGFSGKTRKWFHSYFTNRTLDNVLSGSRDLEARIINCGVSQGSILGALLFLLYINDIPQALTDSTIDIPVYGRN